jgi:hypothetical protein
MFIVQATSLRFEGKVEEPTLRLNKVPHFTTMQNELVTAVKTFIAQANFFNYSLCSFKKGSKKRKTKNQQICD